jgi:hypothetical protein
MQLRSYRGIAADHTPIWPFRRMLSMSRLVGMTPQLGSCSVKVVASPRNQNSPVNSVCWRGLF